MDSLRTQRTHSAASAKTQWKRRLMMAFVSIVLQLVKTSWAQTTELSATTEDLKSIEAGNRTCNPPAIDEFPPDFFTQEQRTQGGIIVHILIATYLIFALGAICDDFFVPVLEKICDTLHMSNDVAGATFMAAGTSAPELFTNIMGTFVTKSDLGIGTIVGSAVFNIFGVISVCGLFSGQRIPLDWYPISRDCFFYGLTVIVLFVVLVDEKVQWWEAMIMVICYSGYIILMALNVRIEKWSHQTVKSIKKRVYPQSSEDQSTPQIPMTTGPTPNESTPLHSATKSTQITVESPPVTSSGTQTLSHEDSVDGSITRINGVHPDGYLDNHDVEEEGDDPGYPWQAPQGVLAKIWWLCFFPTNLLFFLTIPDVRRPSCVNWFPVTFAMCMAWIGAISYEVTWLITVIGYTIRVPDTVMGLSFLAVGTSIPEVFSSLIVSKQGKGSMAVSNSIGSNTFDILICLGVPWMIRALITGSQQDLWFVEVRSEALAYTVISLLISLIVLYAILLSSRFLLSKTLGVVCLIIYVVFLTISLLFELNVFFPVNLPTCDSKLTVKAA